MLSRDFNPTSITHGQGLCFPRCPLLEFEPLVLGEGPKRGGLTESCNLVLQILHQNPSKSGVVERQGRVGLPSLTIILR